MYNIEVSSFSSHVDHQIQESTRIMHTSNNEHSGEYIEETRCPLVRTKDLNNGLVQVEMFIPDLEPGRDRHHPKGGRICIDFFNKGHSLDMRTELVDKIKNVKTIWKFNVKQLPGRIDITESKWGVEKGWVIITMEKHQDNRNINWMLVVQAQGLDQLTSSGAGTRS